MRTISEKTLNHYLLCTARLMHRTMKPTRIRPTDFARDNKITANFIPSLVKAGIVHRPRRGVYAWQGPFPDSEKMAQIIRDYVDVRDKKPTPPATPQLPLDFTRPAANDAERIQVLENRVSVLEQLILKGRVA